MDAHQNSPSPSTAESLSTPSTSGILPKRSKLWDHFDECPGTDKALKLVKCKICSRTVSNKGGNTSNMAGHLQSHHPKQHLEYRKTKSSSYLTSESGGDGEDDGGAWRSRSRSPHTPIQEDAAKSSTSVVRQTTLGQFKVLDVKTQYRLTRSVAYCMATEMLPYNFVEKSGVRHMLGAFQPNYKLPGRKAFAETHIPNLYLETEKIIRMVLLDAQSIAFTTDCWTSAGQDSYISLTAHFIDNQWELQSICLSCTVLNESHTAENLETFLEDALKRWGIEFSTVLCFTTDNGANIVKAVRLLVANRLSCFAHTMQIGIKDVLNVDCVKDAINKCKRLQNIYAASNIFRQAFKDEMALAGKQAKSLPSVSPTRWWSLLHLMQRVVDQHPQLTTTVLSQTKAIKSDHYENDLLRVQEVKTLKYLCDLLTPLEEFSNQMGSEKEVTASAILALLRVLANKLSDPEPSAQEESHSEDMFATSGLRADTASLDHKELETTLKRSLMEAFNKRYLPNPENPKEARGINFSSVTEIHKILQTCTFLDPRFRDHVSEETKADGKVNVIGEILNRKDSTGQQTGLSSNSESCQEPPTKKKKLSGLSAIFSTSPSQSADSASTSKEDAVVAEVDRYERLPSLEFNEDVLKWWKKHEAIFPNLAVLARKYLCISATSVPSERVFSTGGNVITDDRTCLTGEHAEQLIFMAQNKKYVPR